MIPVTDFYADVVHGQRIFLCLLCTLFVSRLIPFADNVHLPLAETFSCSEHALFHIYPNFRQRSPSFALFFSVLAWASDFIANTVFRPLFL